MNSLPRTGYVQSYVQFSTLQAGVLTEPVMYTFMYSAGVMAGMDSLPLVHLSVQHT